MQKKLTFAFAALLLASSLSVAVPQITLAQGAPTVSMVTLQTEPGQNGQQMVVTPKGKVVPLPGAGVDNNVVQIYIGSQGGYWYVDKNGRNVDLTSAVQYMQQRMQSQQMPQYAPYPQQQQPVTVNNYEQSGSSNSGSSSSGLGTAVAAGLGAATGAAVTNSLMQPSYYHGVPYGMPVYYGAHNNPYYVGKGGNNVYVNNSNEVNRNVNANVSQSNYQANVLKQQNDWYNNEAKKNTNTYQNFQKSASGENPFVHPDAQNNWQNARQGGGDQANGGGGRFGRRNSDGGADGGGGRFGNRQSGDGGGGGLLGGREGGGGGFRGRRGR
jgi:hypothetical protein